ncbi:hypothetical protein [Anabaena azotica]|uniref:hypothetical protein n=1 Tax=Anabaena azotica TaxID=197653 RepID=UPI0039A7822D
MLTNFLVGIDMQSDRFGDVGRCDRSFHQMQSSSYLINDQKTSEVLQHHSTIAEAVAPAVESGGGQAGIRVKWDTM